MMSERGERNYCSDKYKSRKNPNNTEQAKQNHYGKPKVKRRSEEKEEETCKKARSVGLTF